MIWLFKKQSVRHGALLLAAGFTLGLLGADLWGSSFLPTGRNKKKTPQNIQVAATAPALLKEPGQGEAFTGRKIERDEIVRRKLEQLYKKSHDMAVSAPEREASMREYYRLMERNEAVISLEHALRLKGYGMVFIDWPEGGLMAVMVSGRPELEDCAEIAALVKEVAGIGPEQIRIRYGDIFE
ncbi:MAG: hypothetical protein ACM3WV_11755 [Bacillota bacterium]